MGAKRWALEDSSLFLVKSSKYCVLFHNLNEEVAKYIWKEKTFKKSSFDGKEINHLFFFVSFA